MKKYRKVGNVICDPESKEAKALVGKMVVYGDFYFYVLNRIKEGKVSTLDKITDNKFRPFSIEDFNTSWGMICAVEEVPEETKYRHSGELDVSDVWDVWGADCPVSKYDYDAEIDLDELENVSEANNG